jgi:CHAT domain-containing protein
LVETRATYQHAWQNLQRGDLTAALQEAESASKKFPDPQSEWHWRFRALRAEILMQQGHYQDSLDLLEAPLTQDLQGSDVAAWQKMTQAAASAFLSRFDDAEHYLHQAQSIVESSQPRLFTDLTLRRGTINFLKGDLASARFEYRRSLDLARQQKDPFLEAAALGSLGLISTRMERYDESIDWNKQALQLSGSIGAVSSVARIKGNMGWSYYQMGDLEYALAQFQQAERDSQQAGLIADRVYWLDNAAVVNYDLGYYREAETISRQALASAKQLNEIGAIIECLQNLALVAIQKKEYSAAQQDLNETTRLESAAHNHTHELYSQLLEGHLAAKTLNFSDAENLYSKIVLDPLAPTSLRWEAQAGLAEVHAAQGKTLAAEREFGEAISTIAKAQRELQHEEFRLSFLSSTIRFYNAYVDFLVAQHRRGDALAIAERSRAQTLTAGLTEPSQALATSFPRVNAQQLAARFHSTLLFYSLGTPHSYLWVITPEKTTLLSLPSQPEIDSLVKSYREQILDGDDPLEAPNSPASKLYSMLVQPAAKLIPPGSRVIVLPDGSLYSLNFETLIVPRPAPHYWIQDVTLTTASSLTLLQRSQSTLPPQDARLFLLGDPVSSDDQFPPLRQAAREMASVKGYFPEDRRRILSGRDATSAAYFSSEPERFDFLHFITHGTASRTHPLDSAVILTKSGDSTKLYAHEIITRPLHAYLVTISACDGVGKRTYAGEGLVGLSWAFLRAGAHNVIASLWEVNDDSTPALMNDLYKGLRAGQDPATALRRAKLSLIRSSGIFRKPFYWAPFQLYAGS